MVPGRVTPTCCQQTWEETHVSHTPGHLTQSCCPNTIQGGGCSWRFWTSLDATGSGPGQFSLPAPGQKAGLVAADPQLCFLSPRRAPLRHLLTLGAVGNRQLPAGFPLLPEAPAFWGGRRGNGHGDWGPSTQGPGAASKEGNGVTVSFCVPRAEHHLSCTSRTRKLFPTRTIRETGTLGFSVSSSQVQYWLMLNTIFDRKREGTTQALSVFGT